MATLSDSPIAGATSYPVNKPVNLAQLEAEIVTSTGVNPSDINVALVGPPDPTIALSDDNAATLWLAPSSLDAGEVTTAITDHSPDSNWGVPTVITDLNTVWAILAANPEATLTSDQQIKLLRGLAFRVLSPSQTPG